LPHEGQTADCGVSELDVKLYSISAPGIFINTYGKDIVDIYGKRVILAKQWHKQPENRMLILHAFVFCDCQTMESWDPAVTVRV
jgi:hypothetical protein